MQLRILVLLIALVNHTEQNEGYCEKSFEVSCDQEQNFDNEKFLFYDVNPPEGFNLRRDVYIRYATMLAEARKRGEKTNWKLVLTPWYVMHHWWNSDFKDKPRNWESFFNVSSLKTYAPVVQLDEIHSAESGVLEVDVLYVLKNYEDPFEGGKFEDKWEIQGPCEFRHSYWVFGGITGAVAKEVICVKFQGKVSKIWELLSVHPTYKRVVIGHAEIPLHDAFGSKAYWDCRKSMKFSDKLYELAREYIDKYLGCTSEKCSAYISVHWRRGDFARSRPKEVPSVEGTAKQIDEFVTKNARHIQNIYLSTDGNQNEIKNLVSLLTNLGYRVYRYVTTLADPISLLDGQIAIIEQIICSHAAYFIGTFESTFTFRIQEEREIMGFDSRTTFNKFCPDVGICHELMPWRVVD